MADSKNDRHLFTASKSDEQHLQLLVLLLNFKAAEDMCSVLNFTLSAAEFCTFKQDHVL